MSAHGGTGDTGGPAAWNVVSLAGLFQASRAVGRLTYMIAWQLDIKRIHLTCKSLQISYRYVANRIDCKAALIN